MVPLPTTATTTTTGKTTTAAARENYNPTMMTATTMTTIEILQAALDIVNNSMISTTRTIDGEVS